MIERSRGTRMPGRPPGLEWVSLTRTSVQPLILPVVVVFFLWEAGAALLVWLDVPLAEIKLPFPHLVLIEAVLQARLLAVNAWSTLTGALAGLALGTLVGIVLGLMLTLSRRLLDVGQPYLIAAQMIPTIALAPIVFAILRDIGLTRVVVAAYLTVFAITLATIRGLQSTPPAALELMHSYAASRRQIYMSLRIPAALPYIFAGLRIAGPLSIVGEIVVELTGASSGLGFLLLVTRYYGPALSNLFWASLILTAIIGYLLARGVGMLEALFVRRRDEGAQASR